MTRKLIRWAAACLLAVPALAVFAHGDEPHGDAPHADAAVEASPRFETVTESFELVGRLQNAVLTLFINRFETNEPVLQAKVELESGDLKALATFQAQSGAYVVTDPKFVAALSQPGSHPLVVTLTAGQDADLMEATLTQAAPVDVAPAGLKRTTLMLLAGGVGVAVVGVAVWRTRQRRAAVGVKA